MLKLSFRRQCLNLCSLKEIVNKSFFVIATPFFSMQANLSTIVNRKHLFPLFRLKTMPNVQSDLLIYTCNMKFQSSPCIIEEKVSLCFSSMKAYSHSSIHSNKIPLNKREFKGNVRYAFN